MRSLCLILAAIPALILFPACGGDDDDDDGVLDRLGNQAVNDHGTLDATGESEIEFEADDVYFDPTFLRGEAGQKLTLKIQNDGNARHNFSIPSQNLDQDIEAGAETTVEITFPQSGVALFLCKYHQGQGMVGELLSGDAQPTAVAGAPSPGSSGTPGATGTISYDPY
jgi:plastocyanin